MKTPSGISVARWETSSRAFTGASAGLLVLLALVPLGFGPNTTNKLTQLFILVILAVMWNALAGFAGLVSVGQQAFIGIGAYSTVLLADTAGVNAYLAVVLSPRSRVRSRCPCRCWPFGCAEASSRSACGSLPRPCV